MESAPHQGESCFVAVAGPLDRGHQGIGLDGAYWRASSRPVSDAPGPGRGDPLDLVQRWHPLQVLN
jgi:hypothetical protein